MQLEPVFVTTESLAVICVAVWVYLLSARGRYWLGSIKDTARTVGQPAQWPAVVAVIPARDESELIEETVGSLLRQEYPGKLAVIVVDDDSSDDTAAAAMRAAAAASSRQLTVIRGKGLSSGWTGKLWALNQGIAAAEVSRPEYLLLTDADIMHAPDTLAWLVTHSLAGRFTLTSLMAKLRCEVSPNGATYRLSFIFFRCFFHSHGYAAPTPKLLRPRAVACWFALMPSQMSVASRVFAMR